MPQEVRSPDPPVSAEASHQAEEESQSVSSIEVLVVEAFGLKLNMQLSVLKMHGNEKQT